MTPVDTGIRFLRHSVGHATIDRPIQLELVRDGLDGDPASNWPTPFDQFVVRINDTQALIDPNDLASDAATVELHLDRVGDALVGFSTKPRPTTDGTTCLHGKLLFPVCATSGRRPPSSAAVSQRIGLTFELVPMIDPVPLLPGTELPLRLRFDGPALANARVEVAYRPETSERITTTTATTDAVGTAIVPIQGRGEYLLTATHQVSTGNAIHRHSTSLYFQIGAPR